VPPRKKKKPDLPKALKGEVSKSTKDFKLWLSRVYHAQRVRKKWEEDFLVTKLEEFFLGRQRSAGDTGIVINHTWATIKAIKPNLFYTNPKFFVRPKPGRVRPVEERQAAVGEGLLESIAQQDQNLKHAGSLAVLQNFFRIAVLKPVFEPRFVKNPSAGEPMWLTDENGEPVVDKQSGQPMPLLDPETREQLKEPDEILTDDVYRWEWVPAENMLLPDEGPDRSKWTWIGEEIVVRLDEAKEDDRFNKSLREKLESNESVRRRDEQAKMEGPEEDSKLFRYFLIYDIKNKRRMAMAEGQSFTDFLIDDDVEPGVEDHPYALLLGWTPIIGPEPLPWPLPHTLPWLPIQEEWNIRRQQGIEGGKRAARKTLYDDNTFPDADQAKRALQSASDMEAVRVTDVNHPPRTMEIPPISSDIWRDIPLLQMDWQLITGRSATKLLRQGEGTATEASFIERASNLIDADMQDAINDWLSMAGHKMLQLVKATMTLGIWIRMRGFSDDEFQKYVERVYQIPQEFLGGFPGLKEAFKERFGKEKWVRVSREQLQFQASVSVVPGSARPRNLEVERNQWLDFLRIIGQFPQLGLSRELLRETAAKFEYVSDRMLDEIHALAQRMVEINARQAGRDQAQGGGAGDGQGVPGLLQGLLASATGGRQQ